MFRFTIRDVLWLMVVVGLGVGWVIDHAVQDNHLDYFVGELGYAKVRIWDLEKLLDESVPNWRATDQPTRPEPKSQQH
jgi:hypothetical protein